MAVLSVPSIEDTRAIDTAITRNSAAYSGTLPNHNFKMYSGRTRIGTKQMSNSKNEYLEPARTNAIIDFRSPAA